MPAVLTEQVHTKPCLLGAVTLAAGVGLTELFHLLEKPLFSRIYYGNFNGVFFGVLSAVFLALVLFFVHRKLKRRTGLTPFVKHPPVPFPRRAVLYLMTALPVLLVSILLGYRFKLVYELGDRVAKMHMWGNAAGYLRAAAVLFAAVYTVFLTEKAIPSKFPVGALASLLLFGVPSWLTDPSPLSVVYFALFFYIGILYRVSQNRFWVTYILSVVLYIL